MSYRTQTVSVTQWRLGLCHYFPLGFRKRTVNKEIEKRGNNKEIVYIRPSRLSSNPYTRYTRTHTHTLVKYNYSIHYIAKQSRAYPTIHTTSSLFNTFYSSNNYFYRYNAYLE